MFLHSCRSAVKVYSIHQFLQKSKHRIREEQNRVVNVKTGQTSGNNRQKRSLHSLARTRACDRTPTIMNASEAGLIVAALTL